MIITFFPLYKTDHSISSLPITGYDSLDSYYQFCDKTIWPSACEEPGPCGGDTISALSYSKTYSID